MEYKFLGFKETKFPPYINPVPVPEKNAEYANIGDIINFISRTCNNKVLKNLTHQLKTRH